MNKRQAKKARKKVVIPFADEMNLLTLTEEEYASAMKDYDEYIQKHCRFKHYRDKEKLQRKRTYFFPAGERYKSRMENMLKSARMFDRGPVLVHQRYAKGIFIEGVTIDSETGSLEEKAEAAESPIAVSKQEFQREIEKFSLRKGK